MKKIFLWTSAVLLAAAWGARAADQPWDSLATAVGDSTGPAIGGPQGSPDSADEYDFLELFYYGPDDDYYEIYDLWDLFPDREGDARDREPEERDGQERDARD
jgi:hypothetical protein